MSRPVATIKTTPSGAFNSIAKIPFKEKKAIDSFNYPSYLDVDDYYGSSRFSDITLENAFKKIFAQQKIVQIDVLANLNSLFSGANSFKITDYQRMEAIWLLCNLDLKDQQVLDVFSQASNYAITSLIQQIRENIRTDGYKFSTVTLGFDLKELIGALLAQGCLVSLNDVDLFERGINHILTWCDLKIVNKTTLEKLCFPGLNPDKSDPQINLAFDLNNDTLLDLVRQGAFIYLYKAVQANGRVDLEFVQAAAEAYRRFLIEVGLCHLNFINDACRGLTPVSEKIKLPKLLPVQVLPIFSQQIKDIREASSIES
jgi:hypothetical protein